MDCTCKLPGMESPVMGRSGFPFELKAKAGSDRKILKPVALSRGGGYHGHGGYYGGGGGVSSPASGLLSSLIPLALTAILAGLVAFGEYLLSFRLQLIIFLQGELPYLPHF